MHEIVQLTDLETEEYLDDYWVQIRYINEILLEGGLKMNEEDVPKLYNRQEILLVESFFKKNTNYSPDSNLGKLIQLIACQESVKIKSEHQPGHKATKRKLKGGAELQEMLNGPIEHFAKAIFSEEYESYLENLKATFFSHRTSEEKVSSVTKYTRRNEALQKLVEEISKEFYLTSK